MPPEKSKGLFYAYIVQYTKDNSRWTDNVIAMFANVDVCEEWWKLINGNTKWSSDMNMTKDALKRHSLQWFSWPATYNARDCMKKIELDPAMDSVRGRWSWRVTSTNRDEYPAFPPIPLQDENGWPLQNPASKANDDIIDTLKTISTTLSGMSANQGAAGGGALVPAGGGQSWDDGPNWPGGNASYQVVENAYTKAKELKDRGDDRSFAMIFGQLSMEMRRKV